MITLFTELDLIRYIYNESTEIEKTDIENAAILNAELQEEIFNLEFAKSLLDKLIVRPSDLSLKNVFNFSLDYTEGDSE